MKRTILLATNNKGKVKELQDMLGNSYNVVTLESVNCDIDVVEDGLTFEENAIKKATEIYNAMKIPCVADDSGLCVDYLDGNPGVFTKRFLGENSTQIERNENLINKLKECPNDKRTASFICSIAYFDGKDKITVEGKIDGKISYERKGNNGFGFDEILIPDGFDKTLAELSSEEKNKISARSKAIKKLKEFLEKN